MIYQCCNENRKALVLQNAHLNGIDYLEVLDHDAINLKSPRQRTLLVHCLNPLAPMTWMPENIRIEGGESITQINMDWVAPALNPSGANPPAQLNAQELAYFQDLPDASKVILVRVRQAGDFSPYRLRLVNSSAKAGGDSFAVTEVLSGFDPQLAEVEFSFRVECGPDFDCAPPASNCPPAAPAAPPINYLSKDFGSFKTLLQDRLSQLLPGWRGSVEADLGVALVELMAYVGDHLSYQQDAVATEAYLETARRRVSLRRHALLVDYRVHDGCNARAWIQLQVQDNRADKGLPSPPGTGITMDPASTRFYTPMPGLPSSLKGNEEIAMLNGAQFFEPLQGVVLFPEHNLISFYTWGDGDCCLPQGATEATLLGSFPNLKPGDVLVFQEVLGPQTGQPEDADVRHRWAVRITQVAIQDGQGNPLVDPLFDSTGAPITNPATQKPAGVTEIQWFQQDALPFPLCLSSTFPGSNGDMASATGVSVALGNMVLADHGLSLSGKSLGMVPPILLYLASSSSSDRCQNPAPAPIPQRFNPQIQDSPLTQQVPLGSGAGNPASQMLVTEAKEAVPFITLTGALNGQDQAWSAQQDLLASSETDRHFVVEIEADGTATLRFGDDTNGLRPDPGTAFTASYRIGNGSDGNLQSDSLVGLEAADARILSCTNPLAAQGGVDPETMEQIRRRASQAFLTQERAVTIADYQTMAMVNPGVERASAALRWTGSWYTAFVTVDPVGGGELSPALSQSLDSGLESYRMAGLDLQLEGTQYVSLEIALTVCVDSNYFQSDVKQELLRVLSNKALPDGRNGVFFQDNFSFGKTVYLSPVYAAARSVAGVCSVVATIFQVQGVDSVQSLASGEIKLGHLQVARMDNDPSYPNHGRLTLNMEGGK